MSDGDVHCSLQSKYHQTDDTIVPNNKSMDPFAPGPGDGGIFPSDFFHTEATWKIHLQWDREMSFKESFYRVNPI